MDRVKALFVLAGYDARAPLRMETIALRLEDRFANAQFKFVGLSYSRNLTSLGDYVKKLGEQVIFKVFGEDSTTRFCRSDGSTCAVESGRGLGRRTRCNPKAENVACARARPQNLVFVCHDRVREEVFKRFGRAALLVRYDSDRLDIDALVEEIENCRGELSAAWTGLSNLARSEQEVARLPRENFQILGGHEIAESVQANVSDIKDALISWSGRLYDPNFLNPKKRSRRGGYRLTDRIYFQQDLLHTDTSHIGNESRSNVFHLINAYYVFGAAITPNFQFDVMADDGGALRMIFEDVLTGAPSDRRETWVDITPCDRVL